MIQPLVKPEYEAIEGARGPTGELPRDPSSVVASAVADWSISSSMAMHSGGRQAGEDDESLTDMMTEITTLEPFHLDDATYQRNVSLIKSKFEQRTN
jgi:hypothetical protein